MPTPTSSHDNKESFFDAQRRNRRATWRLSTVAMVAALAMGLPLTLALTPLLYAATLVVAEIINLLSPLPPEFWSNIHQLGQTALKVADYVINQKGTLDVATLVVGLTVILLPGMAITFVLWLGTLAIFRHGGVGGALATLNAREPNRNDLKELRLANVVEEMAIAAGMAAPKVMLVDAAGANAAAIGTSPSDARLVVSRRLLEDLDRDQLQALLAHLIGSIANGDLQVAFTVTSVFETCGLLVTLINSPFSKESRSRLGQVMRYALRRGPDGSSEGAEAEAIASLLTGSLELGQDEIGRRFETENKPFLSKVVTFAFYPIFFTNMTIEFTLWMFLSVLLGPCMSLLWRTRRYLADASAVQLTRNPDGLAGALKALNQDSTAILNGEWASHLFVMNPKTDNSIARMQPSGEQMDRMARAWATTTPQGVTISSDPNPKSYQEVRSEMAALEAAAMRGDVAARNRLAAFGQAISGAQGAGAPPEPAGVRTRQNKGATGLQLQSLMSFHPSLKRRLRRLERMGAHYNPEAHTRQSVGLTIAMTILYLIVVPLMTAAGVMVLMVMAMLVMLNLVFLGLWMTVIHGIFSLLGHK